MFDLAALDILQPSEEGRDFIPRHPNTGAPWIIEPAVPAVPASDGKPAVPAKQAVPLTFTLLGRWAGICQTKSDEITARADARPAGAPAQSPEEMIADNAEYLSVAIRRWTLTHLDGQPYPCTVENARKLLTDPRFSWLRSQLLTFHRNDGNFLAVPTAGS